MVIVVTPIKSIGPPASPYQLPPHKDHKQAGHNFQTRYQQVRHDVLAGKESQQTNRDYGGRMGKGYNAAQKYGVPYRSTAADQVGGHQGFAMARRKRVQATQSQGQSEGRNQQQRWQIGITV